MEQYHQFRRQYPDAILFFQIGDFYETFDSDAELVARELDITLTSRSRNTEGERTPLAGVPYHAATGYISKLIEKGYKVAVCDQVGEAGKGKLVRREVVRVITPGTVLDEGMIPSPDARYLMAGFPDRDHKEWGLAFLDVTTGEFHTGRAPMDSSGSGLLSELARYGPAECLFPTAEIEMVRATFSDGRRVIFPYDDGFSREMAFRVLQDHFRVSSLDGFGLQECPASVIAAGAVLCYAKNNQSASLDHITSLQPRLRYDHLVLDATTMRNLEVIRNVRGGTEGTLLSTLDRTVTSPGRRLLKRWVIAPLADPDGIIERLDGVEFLHKNMAVSGRLNSLLKSCADIERIAGRIGYNNATPRDLVALKKTLETVPEMKQVIARAENQGHLLAEAEKHLHDLGGVICLIERGIADDPPPSVKNGGFIRSGYSSELDSLREVISGGKDWIARFQQAERERTGIRSLKIGYNSVFGYYIEVTRPNLPLVPGDYERRQTTSTSERFITRSLKEKEELLSSSDERIMRLERDLFETIIKEIRVNIPMFQEIAGAVATVDVLVSLAMVAGRNNYTRPVVSRSDRIVIREGRHPVVESSIPGRFVANDTDLSSSDDQVLIITGANMAGKSTFMRSVALTVIMAQTGSFVPAEYAAVGVADRIFTRVGAFDDLASGQSTFMVEMTELATILQNVTERSLVILDEIGRGTSTLDGSAIAGAVLEFLHGKGSSGPKTLFATHFHELVGIERDLKRVRNVHFAVRETGGEVVFLRRLIPGATDRSYGIHVAALAGVPRSVIRRAEELLKKNIAGSASGPGPRCYTQLLLVSPETKPDTVHPVVERLSRINTDEVTPRDALSLLYELREILKRGEG
jgi:DNA mismatch repair protein MutS